MTETAAPVRIERDGDVAVVVLDNPPLNLFTPAVFDALETVAAELVALTDPSRPDRARAVLFEARGKVVSAGVDVTFFRDIAEGPEPVAPRRRALGAAAAGRADHRGPAGAHRLRRARAHASPRRSSWRWPATSCWPPRRRRSGWSRSSSG